MTTSTQPDPHGDARPGCWREILFGSPEPGVTEALSLEHLIDRQRPRPAARGERA